jgi:hypothetical protein
MEFRASTNGATELQAAKLVSTAYIPVRKLWIDIFMSGQPVTSPPPPPSYQADAKGQVRPRATSHHQRLPEIKESGCQIRGRIFDTSGSLLSADLSCDCWRDVGEIEADIGDISALDRVHKELIDRLRLGGSTLIVRYSTIVSPFVLGRKQSFVTFVIFVTVCDILTFATCYDGHLVRII